MADKVAVGLRRLYFGSWRIVRGELLGGIVSCRVLGCGLALIFYSAAGNATNPSDIQLHDINIPRLNVAEAINRLAEQSGATLLFPYDITKSRQANSVVGRYTVIDALHRLLKGSGLTGGLTDKGVIKIHLLTRLSVIMMRRAVWT